MTNRRETATRHTSGAHLSSTVRNALRSSARPYLGVIALLMIIGPFIGYLDRGEPFMKGQSASIIFVLIATGLVVLVWWPLQGRQPMGRLPRVIIGAALLLWIVVTLRIAFEDGSFNYTAFATPVLLMVLLLKPPRLTEAWFFGDMMALGLAAGAIITQLLDYLGVRPSRIDIISRWDFLPDPFSLPARWEGFFGDPNLAGFIGAFLTIYCARRPAPIRIPGVAVGLVIVLLSESRTALVAVLVGAVMLVASQPWRTSRAVAITGKSLLVITAAVIAIVGFALTDPTLNGRTVIWSSMLELFVTSPLQGVGATGITEASQQSTIPWGNTDGHSVFLDVLARNGLLAGVLSLVIISGSLVVGFRARHTDRGVSIAVTSTFLVGALTYTVTSWQYPTIQIAPLLVALLLAQATNMQGGIPAVNDPKHIM